MIFSIFKRSPQSTFRLCIRCISSTQREPWQPWEDKFISNYVRINGKKWSDIAQHILPNRTSQQIQTRWSDILNPTLKRGPFTDQERDLLKKGVDAIGEGRWSAISQTFLPHRSPRRIANEWIHRNNNRKKYWTQQEDDLLLTGVEKYGWQWTKIVKEFLPGRNRMQVRTRYVRYLDPSVKKDKWTDTELELLLRRTIRYGQDWTKVAEGIPGRTAIQCSYVWANQLDPALNKSPWSDKETRLFWEKLVESKGRLNQIQLPGRSTMSCSNRFYATVRHDKEFHVLYKEQIKRQKSENANEWRMRIAELVIQYLDRGTTMTKSSSGSIQLLKPGSWGLDELEKLKELVDKSVKVDWKEIATHFEGRNAKQCKYQYEEHIAIPDLKKGEWTQEEDELLLDQINKYGTHWKHINIPHRNMRQCQYRWNRVLKYDNRLHAALTEKEKELIREGVNMFGNNWTAIQMSYLPHRSPYHIMRWWNGHSPGIRWTEEQDKSLTFAVQKYKDDWTKVEKLVDGKSAEQCKVRWLYSLDPSATKGHWSYEEQMMLYEIVQKHLLTAVPGKSIWPDVTKELGTGRTEWSCRLKFKRMKSKGVGFR